MALADTESIVSAVFAAAGGLLPVAEAIGVEVDQLHEAGEFFFVYLIYTYNLPIMAKLNNKFFHNQRTPAP